MTFRSRNRIESLLKIPRAKRDELGSRIFRTHQDHLHEGRYVWMYALINTANQIEDLRNVQ